MVLTRPINNEAGIRGKWLRKFLHHFPNGYQGKKYKSWERDYKWNAHLLWEEKLNKKEFKRLLDLKEYAEIAKRAVNIESKTNLLFSFEKMALRDAIKDDEAAKTFSKGLFDYIYGTKSLRIRFEHFVTMMKSLPVKQTRVVTWPVLTVFGFLADPVTHIYLKPTVTKVAAKKYGFDFNYSSKPEWKTYQSLLNFGNQVRNDTAKYEPVDNIDIQSFIWVTGSEEYPD